MGTSYLSGNLWSLWLIGSPCDWLGHPVIDWYPALSGVVILYQLMLLKLVLTAWAICFWAKIYLFRDRSSFRGKRFDPSQGKCFYNLNGEIASNQGKFLLGLSVPFILTRSNDSNFPKWKPQRKICHCPHLTVHHFWSRVSVNPFTPRSNL